MKLLLFPLLLVVLACRCVASNVTITTTSVPNGTVNTSYSAVIKANGGCTPYKWALTSGALPAGVTAKVSSTTTSLNLAGTPRHATTYSFTEKVTGCGGVISQASYRSQYSGHGRPCCGAELEGFDLDRRRRLQRLSQSRWIEVDEDKRKHDCFDTLQRFHRCQ